MPSLGLLMTVSGMAVCREAVRIAALGQEQFEALFPRHAEAVGKSGLFAFLGFFTVNAALIGFVFWLVQYHSAAKPAPSQPPFGTPETSPR